MAAVAVQSLPLEPLVGSSSSLLVSGQNPESLVRDAASFVGSAYTSLPLLPKYQYNASDMSASKRWGEDEVMERLGFQVTSSGYGRLRQHVDTCHPVPDVTAANYEGYMFPKAMEEDVSVFRKPDMNNCRHVPRDSGYDLFPKHDPQRLMADGQYVLGESSREALARYVKQLYQSSGYNTTFKDTAEFMKCRMDREAQFSQEHPKSNAIPTCSRILNHSDPCPLCWTGDLHTAYEHDLAYIQSQLCDCPKRRTYGCEADAGGDQRQIPRLGEANMIGAACQGCKDGGLHSGITNMSDHLFNGPTENEFVSSSEERHRCHTSCYTNNDQHYGPWAALNRVVGGSSQLATQGNVQEKHQEPGSQTFDGASQPPVSYPNNRWTYRDQDNLRIPCIAQVIGNTNKSEAHKRFHKSHTELTPELRDFTRYSKRVTFYGYNSFVYR